MSSIPQKPVDVYARFNAAKASDGMATYEEARQIWTDVIAQGGVSALDMHRAAKALGSAELAAIRAGFELERLCEALDFVKNRYGDRDLTPKEEPRVYLELVEGVLNDPRLLAYHPRARELLMQGSDLARAVARLNASEKPLSAEQLATLERAAKVAEALQNLVAAWLIMDKLGAVYEQQTFFEKLTLFWKAI